MHFETVCTCCCRLLQSIYSQTSGAMQTLAVRAASGMRRDFSSRRHQHQPLSRSSHSLSQGEMQQAVSLADALESVTNIGHALADYFSRLSKPERPLEGLAL